ncbi:MAG: M50 family metallopeptidase [Anaerolineae bacterium]|jgi:regulator of sigma E protease
MGTLSIVAWFTATLVFVLGPIILIHELGHFLSAKRAGVRVEEFGLGLPPRLLTLAGEPGMMRIGSIEFTIPGRLRLPFGLAKGEQVEALARQEEDGTYRLRRLTLPEEASATPSRQETQEGVLFRGEVTNFEPGTRYTLNALPFGGFVRMTGEEDPSDPRSLAAQPKRQRLGVLLAGPLLNLLAAFLLFAATYMAGHPEKFHARVEYVQPGTAAAAAGIQSGDIIFAIDGVPIEDGTEQIQEIVKDAAGETLALYIVRDKEPITLSATPRQEEGHGVLGIAMRGEWPASSGVVHYPPHEAAVFAAEDMVSIVARMIQLPRLLAQGDVQPAEVRPTSAVGINAILTFTLQQSVEWGIPYPALYSAALVSLALGATNLLPLPALDGGRVLFVLIEAIRRRRINPEIESRIHFAAMVILVALMLFIMVQDVVNPLIDWSLLRR